MRACVRASEADAQLDEWGVMCPAPLPVEVTRNLFMTAYPRMVEILQLLGSSSFMIIPSEVDFASPLAPDIEQYLATVFGAYYDHLKASCQPTSATCCRNWAARCTARSTSTTAWSNPWART